MTRITSPSRPCRIGIDVGGTFTDFVLSDARGEKLHFFKEPSTPSDPSEAVERGVQGILDRAGVVADDIDLIVHGTTIGLNAIIQRNGAPLSMVVSQGNGDIMEIARGRLSSAFDFLAVKEEPIVPRDRVYEVDIRVRADGTVDEGDWQAEIDAIAAKVSAAGIKVLSVVLLNSYRHPESERMVADALRKRLPDVLISESAQVWPEIREYERALVVCLNGYIGPLMNRYFDRLLERLERSGVTAPVYITTNNGGTIGIGSARSRPIDTVLSGPSAGVVASTRLGRHADVRQLLTFDMGGTSSDLSIISAGELEYTTRTFIGDFPLMLPVVSVSAIGAGGGSIVWLDKQNVLKVGPTSAGAAPGPICYGRGGTVPTVTDCYLAMGVLRADGFLGGRMQLDRAASVAALAALGKAIGLDGEDAAGKLAESALWIATSKMATEVFKLFAQRGLDPRSFTLVAYGGAGPTHANLLAEELGLSQFLIPPSPGTLCALGAILTDLRRDYVRTIRMPLASGDEVARKLAEAARQLEAEASAWLDSETVKLEGVARSWSADLKYAGEGQETPLALSGDLVEGGDLDRIAELFHQEHDRLYSFRSDDSGVDLVNLRLSVTGLVSPIALPVLGRSDGAAPRPSGKRPIFNRGSWIDADIYARADLRSGDRFAGPALLEQEDTTVLILPGWHCVVDDRGIILASRAG